MQLEELQQQWQRLDDKLDRTLALETELVRQIVLQPAHRRVNRLAIWPAIDVALSVGVLLLGVALILNYGRDGRLVVPAGVVMLGAVALLADSIRQLERVARLDWCGPVAQLQSSLDTIRVAKIRQFKWLMLLAPLVGFCGLIAGLHGLFAWLTAGRVSVLDKLDPWWVAANYAFGLLFVPLGYFVARRLAAKCRRRGWWQGVLDDISDKSLTAASQDVDRWASLQDATLNDSE